MAKQPFNFNIFIFQNALSSINLEHNPMLTGSLISIRYKSSTPVNTAVMFVPQQEVYILC